MIIAWAEVELSAAEATSVLDPSLTARNSPFVVSRMLPRRLRHFLCCSNPAYLYRHTMQASAQGIVSTRHDTSQARALIYRLKQSLEP
jgi:hypothetical protein